MIIEVTRNDFSIVILGDEQDYKNTCNNLAPYFSIQSVDRKSIGINWTINMCDNNHKNLKIIWEKQIANEPSKIFSIDKEKKEIGIVQPTDKKWKFHIALRIIRDLYRVHLVNDNAVPLHGGLIEYNGLGVAVLGTKRSGKTTTILSMVAKEGGYVTNDDLIMKQINSELYGYGSPRTITIRRDTLPFIKGISPKTNNEFLENPLNKTKLIDDFLFVKPIELSKLFGSTKETKSYAKINKVIFPRFVDSVKDIGVVVLEPEELKNAIKENIENTTHKYFPMLFSELGFTDMSNSYFRNVVEKLDFTEVEGLKFNHYILDLKKSQITLEAHLNQ